MRIYSTLLLLIAFVAHANCQKIDSLKNQLKTASEVEKPQILIELCDANMNHDNELALDYAAKAIIASEHVKDSISLIKSQIMRGELLTATDQYVEARSILDAALANATAINSKHELSDVHCAFGSLYYSLFDQEKSIYHYKIGTNLAKEVNDVRLLVKNMNNMASLFEIQGEFELALKSFIECTEVMKGTPREGGRIYYVTILNSGIISGNLEDYSSSVKYLKEALAGFRKKNIRGLEIHTIVALVDTYTKLGKLDSAMHYYELTKSYTEQLQIVSQKHYRDQIYYELLFKMKKYNKVIDLVQKKLEIIEQDTNLTVYAANAAQLLYKTYKTIGDHKKALKHLEQYNKLNAYSKSKASENEVKLLRTRFETELDFEAKSKELLELQLLDDIQQKEIEKQKYWRNLILAISFLGFVISLLILYGLKLQKKASDAETSRLEVDNSKLQMEVQHKNRELTSTAMFVAEKNQMLMNLEEHLSHLKTNSTGISNQDLRNIKNQIKDNIRLEEDWENIKLHFEEVYPDFFDRLKNEHQQLTPLELKHCAYLRMSLSVKEVARMLSVAPKSVQMSHYRLKKKLGLETEDSLRDYVSKF